MDVDKVFEEYAQSVRQTGLQEIRFTPALEKKIREKIATRKKRFYRYFASAATAAALLAVSVYLFPALSSWESATVEQQTPNTGISSSSPTKNSFTKSEQEMFNRLKQVIPELQQYQLEQAESYFSVRHLFLRKSQTEYARFGVDQETGSLQYFSLGEPQESPARQADVPARERAAAFVRAVVDDGDAYRIRSMSLAYEIVDQSENKSRVVGTNISFKKEGAKEFPQQGSVTVRLNAEGSITAFSRVGQFDQSALDKLILHVPKLREYDFEQKTPFSGGYNLVLRKNEKEFAIVGIEAAEGEKTGRLSSFQLTAADTTETQGAASDREMTDKASAFVRDVLGDDSQSYRLQEKRNDQGKFTHFTFQRFAHDLPVVSDSLNVTCDKSGSIRSYYASQAKSPALAQFADPTEAIPQAAAEKELAAHMKLVYRTVPAPFLEYTPAANSIWDIDAKTGKIRFQAMSMRAVASNINFDESSEPPIKLSVPKDQATVKNKEEALALMKKEFGFDPAGFVFSEHEDKMTNEKYYSWESSSRTPGKNARIITDMKTGRIHEIGMFRKDAKVKVKREEAQREAIRFLANYIDPKITEVQLAEVIDAGEGNGYTSSGDWGFGFYRSYQGIPVADNQLSDYYVSVDPSTGKANGFSKLTERRRGEKSASKETKLSELPDSTKVVAPEEAAREYLNYYQLQLAYKLEPTDQPNKYVPVLVYTPVKKEAQKGSQIKIDALTGKAVRK